MKEACKSIDNAIDATLKYLALFCMICLFIILIFNVFFRLVPILSVFPSFSMGWFDEIVEMLFAWLIMTTASYLCKHGEHFRVDIIQMQIKNKRWLCILESAIDIIALAFYVGLMLYGYKLTAQAVQTTPVLMMQKKWMYSCMPVNALLMVIFTFTRLCGHFAGIVNFNPESKTDVPSPPEATDL